MIVCLPYLASRLLRPRRSRGAHYGVDGSAERLSAEFDDAFRLVAGDSSWFVKVGLADGAAPRGRTAVSFQTAVLLHLAAAAPGLPVQRVVPRA